MDTPYAFIAQGVLHFLEKDGKINAVESEFGKKVCERAFSIYQRNAWKREGTGAHFMSGGLIWAAGQQQVSSRIQVFLTGLAKGRLNGEWFYSLDTGSISGMFRMPSDQTEQRLFHTSEFHMRHPSVHLETGEIACSLTNRDGSTNIAYMSDQGAGVTEVTEGDSMDLAPSWVPGTNRRLVFQSAGIARDSHGHFRGYGPFAIHSLDLDENRMNTLCEDPQLDYLWPKMELDGSLHFIRRPYVKPGLHFHWGRFLMDILLFPFRFLFAILQYCNFFTIRYTGKPLSTVGGARQRDMDLKRMMVQSNILNAAQAYQLEEKGKEEDTSLVPSSSQLIRRLPSGQEDVLAKGVLSFDLCSGGSILYSDGATVFRVDKEGRQVQLAKGQFIEQVVAG
jgi:hypothetical protein